MVVQLTCNQYVGGSSPSVGTIICIWSQMVRQKSAKLSLLGSIPSKCSKEICPVRQKRFKSQSFQGWNYGFEPHTGYHGPLAQWQSVWLLTSGSQVRILRGPPCFISIMVIISAFQAEDVGSIPTWGSI